MSDVRIDGEKASALANIEAAIIGEGFTSIEELVNALHDKGASLVTAETARDKLAEANKAASVIIGTKGNEQGKLKQENAEQATTIIDLTKQLESKGETPNAPSTTTTTTAIPLEEQLKAVEDKMTDEHWNIADQMLNAEQDDEKSRKLVEDVATRLQFLKELSADPINKQRPTSFRKVAIKDPASGGAESEYTRIKQSLSANPMGPSGSGVVQRSTSGAPIQRQPSRLRQ
jgi:hypothetical protein